MNNNTFALPPRVERITFYLILFITTAFLFYSPYLPMVDLPQHAAQVATLDDLLKNRSPWSNLVILNWDTPYLTGYALWLLLYQFMDINLSSKVLVAFIFLFYTYAIHLLRKNFQASPILEWAAMTSFFGFAFQWGFITFLLATPIGILFFLSCKNWLESGKYKYFICFSLLGVVMYFSHVLIFAFFCFLSYFYFLFTSAKDKTWKQRLIFTLPFLFYAAMLYRYTNKPNLWAFQYYEENFIFQTPYDKTIDLFYLPWHMLRLYKYQLADLGLLLLLPALGFRLRCEVKFYIPLIVFLIIWYALPTIGFQTNFIYQRFALFLLPFYYLIWRKQQPPYPRYLISSMQLGAIGFVLCFSMLIWKFYYNQIIFSREPSVVSYPKIEQAILPKKRVLTLHTLASRHSSSFAMTSYMEFLYFPNWYQAEKHGWVDFNFASFHPQIVRFRPEYLKHLPSRSAELEGIAALTNCMEYDYLLMKSEENVQLLSEQLATNKNCRSFKLLAQEQDWMLYKNSQEINRK